MKFTRGFTLIEILLVIAIIGILTVIIVVAINPAKRLAQARDAKRISDVNQIANALQAYYATHASYPNEDAASITESQTGANCWYIWNAGSSLLDPSHKFLESLVTDGALKRVPIEKSPVPGGSGNRCSYRYAKSPPGNCGCTSGYAVIFTSLEEAKPGGGDDRPECIRPCWYEGGPTGGFAVYLPE